MRAVLWGVLVVGMMSAPGARAESDQFCFDQMRAIEAQMQRAQAMQCNLQGGIWTGDMKAHFAFCRANEAAANKYWQNQRESQLKYCEVVQHRGTAEYVDGFRISGAPGAYTIHWTIRYPGCEVILGNSCYMQIRMETPTGHAGDFAVEVAGKNRLEGFTTNRADRYPGQAGDIVVLKWHSCGKPGIGASHCHAWNVLPLVMPPAVPDFRPARITALDPSEWIPQRLRKGETQARMVTPGAMTQLKVRLDGTKDGFTPAPFQDAQAWTPELKLRLFARGALVRETGPMSFPPNGTAIFDVPLAALDGQQCGPNVGVSNLCATLGVEVESFRRWTSGNTNGLQESMGKSRKELPLVTPMAAITAQKRLKQGPPPNMNLGGIAEPASITSACGVTHRIGRVDFTARQGNVDRLTVNAIPVDLQYAAGQGLWGTSTLLTGLQAVPNSNPPDYRASLQIADLLKSGSNWRWRVKAAQGGKPGDWCQFAVAPAPGAGEQRLRTVR